MTSCGKWLLAEGGETILSTKGQISDLERSLIKWQSGPPQKNLLFLFSGRSSPGLSMYFGLRCADTLKKMFKYLCFWKTYTWYQIEKRQKGLQGKVPLPFPLSRIKHYCPFLVLPSRKIPIYTSKYMLSSAVFGVGFFFHLYFILDMVPHQYIK